MTRPVRYFDDFAPGDRFEIGSFALSQDDIIDFALQYDPQPFHIDPEEAAGSMFNGVIASGWQTAACVMRLMVDGFISPESSLGSPGMDELRWIRPVRPDVRYSASVLVADVRASESKPDRGTIWMTIELVDPDGDPVYTAKGMGLYRRREQPAEG